MDEIELIIETVLPDLSETLLEFFGSPYERFIDENDVLESAFDVDCY